MNITLKSLLSDNDIDTLEGIQAVIDIGLLIMNKNNVYTITDLGRRYFKACGFVMVKPNMQRELIIAISCKLGSYKTDD